VVQGWAKEILLDNGTPAGIGESAQSPQRSGLEGFFHEVLRQEVCELGAEFGAAPEDFTQGFWCHAAEVARLVIQGPEERADELPQNGIPLWNGDRRSPESHDRPPPHARGRVLQGGEQSPKEPPPWGGEGVHAVPIPGEQEVAEEADPLPAVQSGALQSRNSLATSTQRAA